jgi:hypothetical protein
VPKYKFRILTQGMAEEVAELDFPSDAAALRDARFAIGDAIRDMALNRTTASEQIEILDQEGHVVGRVSTHSPDES